MKRLLVAALLAGSAFQVVAAADPPVRAGCDVRRTDSGGQQPPVWLGYGYVVSPGNAVTIRCYVTIDGWDAASTPTGTGMTAAVTAGQLSWLSAPDQDVRVCTEWSVGGGPLQTACS